MVKINENTVNPLPAIEKFRQACYDMAYAMDNRVLAEVVDKNGAPLNRSVDEMLFRLAEWCEDTAEDYQEAIERGC